MNYEIVEFVGCLGGRPIGSRMRAITEPVVWETTHGPAFSVTKALQSPHPNDINCPRVPPRSPLPSLIFAPLLLVRDRRSLCCVATPCAPQTPAPSLPSTEESVEVRLRRTPCLRFHSVFRFQRSTLASLCRVNISHSFSQDSPHALALDGICPPSSPCLPLAI